MLASMSRGVSKRERLKIGSRAQRQGSHVDVTDLNVETPTTPCRCVVAQCFSNMRKKSAFDKTDVVAK